MALCAYPYYQSFDGVFFACGRCHVCRINKRREWTARLMLEASQYDKRCFVTYTYNNKNVPRDMNLKPKHMTNYFKSLRKSLSKLHRKMRYFYCGEYGDRFGRPHYHAILFGIDEKELDLILKHWKYGNIFVGSVTSESVQYVCGYVLKKTIKSKVPGRVLEFSRMSLKPGIGSATIKQLADNMHTGFFPVELEKGGDVPAQIRLNGKMWPLGRYLKSKLRKEMGIDEVHVKKVNKILAKAEAERIFQEVETKAEFQAELKMISKFCEYRGTKDKTLEAQMKLTMYNRTKIMQSEQLSKIYNKRKDENK